MADLAEFETAPPGTVRRTSPDGGWIDALVGDKLGDGHQSNNTQSNDYRVRLYPDAEMRFDSITEVTLDNIEGKVQYQNSSDAWIQVTDPGQYNMRSVATGGNGGGVVSVVCSTKGAFRPPPWK